MNNNTIIAILVIIIAVGGYLYWKDQNTTTINLPGDNKIEIEK